MIFASLPSCNERIFPLVFEHPESVHRRRQPTVPLISQHQVNSHHRRVVRTSRCFSCWACVSWHRWFSVWDFGVAFENRTDSHSVIAGQCPFWRVLPWGKGKRFWSVPFQHRFRSRRARTVGDGGRWLYLPCIWRCWGDHGRDGHIEETYQGLPDDSGRKVGFVGCSRPNNWIFPTCP